MQLSEYVNKYSNEVNALSEEIELSNKCIINFNQINEQIDKNKNNLTKKNDFLKIQNKLVTISCKNDILSKKEKIIWLDNIDKINLLLSNTEAFYVKHRKLFDQIEINSDAKNKISLCEDEIKQSNTELEKLRITSNNTNKELSYCIDLINKSIIIFDEIKKLKLDIERDKLKLKKLEEKLTRNYKSILEVEKAIISLSQVNIKSYCSDNIIEEKDKLNELYEIFKNNHSLLIALESDLFESNIKVKELESHNNSLSKLISIGTEIVNKSESSDCPLCSKKYGNFQELKAAIESNKIIGLLSANLIKNNLEIKEKIENIKHENKKIELEHSSIVILQLDKQLNIKNSISTENFSLNIDKKAINNILSDFEKQLKDKIKLTGYKSEKYFNNDLLTRKDNLLRNDSGINYQINNVIKNIDATKKEISKINNIISISNKEQLYIINDTLYKDFKKESVPFLNNVFNDINYSQELLNKHLEKSKIIINELSNVINLENYRINELKSNIPLEYKNATSDYIDSLIKEIDVDCIEIDEYLKEYKKCFPDNISYWSDLEYCKKYITLKLGQLENSLAKTVVKLDELNVLTNLSSKAGLLSESISIQKENIELEIDIKNNIDLKYIS